MKTRISLLTPSLKKYNLIVLALSLAVLSQSTWMAVEAQSRKTLQGSATFYDTEYTGASKHAYYPKDRWLRHTDQLTIGYKLGAAEAEYRKMLRQNPANAGAHNGLGKVTYFLTTSSNELIREKREAMLTQAIQHFHSALRYQPNYVEARVNLGTIYMEQGRLAEAEEEFQRAYQLNPHDSEVLEKLGAVRVLQEDYNGGLPYLERAVQLQSGNSSAYYYLGIAYTARGEYNKAHNALQTSLYQYPNSAPVHHQLGILYDAQGNGAAAVGFFKKALELKPEYMESALKLAQLYEERGDLDLALEQYKNMASSYGEREDLFFKVAELSLKNRQPDVAAMYYQQVLNHNPNHQKAREGYSLSQTQLATQKLSEGRLASVAQAKKSAEQALVYNPKNLDARLIGVKYTPTSPSRPDYSLSEAYAVLSEPANGSNISWEQGEVWLDRFNFPAAEHAFRMALLSAGTGNENLTYGELLLEKGMPELSKEAFERASALSNDHGAAQIGLQQASEAIERSNRLVAEARLFQKKNAFQAAQPLLEESLKLNMANAGAHYQLARLHEERKQYGLAADHYYAYLKLMPMAEDRVKIEKKIDKLVQAMKKRA